MGRGDYLKDLGSKGQSAAMQKPEYEPRQSLSPRSSPKKSGDYLKDLGRKGMEASLGSMKLDRPVSSSSRSPPVRTPPAADQREKTTKPTAAASPAAGGKAAPMTRAEVKAQIEAEKQAILQVLSLAVPPWQPSLCSALS